ncbi:hypothetical protein CJO78_17130 (plasmid) [Ralstonia solanacearum]|nr:hypothetical protein CJO78_17130 [Ralstonia solanacearum]
MVRDIFSCTLRAKSKFYRADNFTRGKSKEHYSSSLAIARNCLVCRFACVVSCVARVVGYDHAVILDADTLDAKDLYVAMTRGSKSLTIIGTSRYLPAR